MWQHSNMRGRQIHIGTDNNLTRPLLQTLTVTSFRLKRVCQDSLCKKPLADFIIFDYSETIV
jgi:hypothetical protein